MSINIKGYSGFSPLLVHRRTAILHVFGRKGQIAVGPLNYFLTNPECFFTKCNSWQLLGTEICIPTQVSEGITLFLLLALTHCSCIFTRNIFISLHFPI